MENLSIKPNVLIDAMNHAVEAAERHKNKYKLYLLEFKDIAYQYVGDFYFRFVVSAKSEKSARKIICDYVAKNEYTYQKEKVRIWSLPSCSLCVEIGVSSRFEEKIISDSFNT